MLRYGSESNKSKLWNSKEKNFYFQIFSFKDFKKSSTHTASTNLSLIISQSIFSTSLSQFFIYYRHHWLIIDFISFSRRYCNYSEKNLAISGRDLATNCGKRGRLASLERGLGNSELFSLFQKYIFYWSNEMEITFSSLTNSEKHFCFFDELFIKKLCDQILSISTNHLLMLMLYLKPKNNKVFLFLKFKKIDGNHFLKKGQMKKQWEKEKFDQ